jgi:hypothetical protein
MQASRRNGLKKATAVRRTKRSADRRYKRGFWSSPNHDLTSDNLRAAAPGDPARVINVGSIDGIQVPLLETYA